MYTMVLEYSSTRVLKYFEFLCHRLASYCNRHAGVAANAASEVILVVYVPVPRYMYE